jgi:hypothetical protein
MESRCVSEIMVVGQQWTTIVQWFVQLLFKRRFGVKNSTVDSLSLGRIFRILGEECVYFRHGADCILWQILDLNC